MLLITGWRCKSDSHSVGDRFCPKAPVSNVDMLLITGHVVDYMEMLMIIGKCS